MVSINRLANVGNPFQGNYKKVLCVCSAGLLRSPTAAHVLSNEPFNFNTRSAGLSNEYALIPVDKALLMWSDEVVVMERWQKHSIIEDHYYEGPVICLEVPDHFEYRDSELMELIKDRYLKIRGESNGK